MSADNGAGRATVVPDGSDVEDEQPDVQDDIAAAERDQGLEGGVSSILDQIRGDVGGRVREAPRTDIKFPSADGQGLIWVRYRPLLDDEKDVIRERARKFKGSENLAEFNAGLDHAIVACEAILVKNGDSLVELHRALGLDEPVRFDETLVEHFKGPNFPGLAEAGTARKIVKALAGVGQVGSYPLERHCNDLLRWMTSDVADRDEELLGE